ncbi:NDP-sugar pyrophosphorylase family protein [Lachnospiraceae bacterium PM6-15]|uniref:nucleotidyltransferase family protein n=1 Tax=Ohessyouella blattaphilus TaxID=2949333 RepID=UPI003E32B2F2
MKEKPSLLIMAAGMGSRYGGLKQMDPVDEMGRTILDYSLFDARKAGFERVIFVIKEEFAEEFKEKIGKRVQAQMEVVYAYQEISKLLPGYDLPKGRVKPWGTAHAVLCAKPYITGPIAVINADDYYGEEAFALIMNFLANTQDNEKYRYGMVAYELNKTVTEHGYVSRGVCQVDKQGQLESVVERTQIEVKDDKICYQEKNQYFELPKDTLVSMNFWGFSKSIVGEIQRVFKDFLDYQVPENPLKAEFFLPTVVSRLIAEEKASVQVLQTSEQWYGVTYHEDKEKVVEALRELRQKGRYSE